MDDIDPNKYRELLEEARRLRALNVKLRDAFSDIYTSSRVISRTLEDVDELRGEIDHVSRVLKEKKAAPALDDTNKETS